MVNQARRKFNVDNADGVGRRHNSASGLRPTREVIIRAQEKRVVVQDNKDQPPAGGRSARPSDSRATSAVSGAAADTRRIECYLRGDERTFREMDSWILSEMRSNYPALRAEHEDLCQVVHEKLLANRGGGRFHGRSTLRTYVSGIAHHTAIDRLRELYRERALARLYDPGHTGQPENPYRTVEAMDESKLLHQVLQALPASCRQLWHLALVGRLSYEEIGRQLSIPPGTVKSRMWHCRRRATELLERMRRRRPRRRER